MRASDSIIAIQELSGALLASSQGSRLNLLIRSDITGIQLHRLPRDYWGILEPT